MLFNTTKVNEKEFLEYLNTGYVDNDDFKNVRNVYMVLLILITIYMIVSLVFFYKLRDSYIVRQRNFGLTFAEGIFVSINLFNSILPQLIYVHCLTLVFTANVLNTAVILIFLSRSLRVILFYHLNYFKVSSFSNEKTNRTIFGTNSIEPNNYLIIISKKINKIIAAIIIIPTVLATFITLMIYLTNPQMRTECPVMEKQDALVSMKQNKAGKLYAVVAVFGAMYMVFSVIISFLILSVKDVNKYGVKFECLSVSIMIFLIQLINVILQKKASSRNGLFKYNDQLPLRGYLDIYEKTDGGKTFFSIILFYMFFVSITLPIIHYYRNKRIQDAYFQDPTSSPQYFYKVLQTPSLVNELREIAIREFSVENVLFWESYKVLQKMIIRYQAEYQKAKEIGNIESLNQYDFEKYYFQQMQMQSYSDSSLDGVTYDPTMPIPKELMKYFMSFYRMFIDPNGPSVVNISSDTAKKIFHEICLYPTVSIFDDAKEEVISNMYTSIYPILLMKNKIHTNPNLV
jgi:hypothetical protein